MNQVSCYIGFGSNLGDRLATCKAALEGLGQLPDTKITAVSSLYETEPVCSEGSWFYNGVVELSTALDPQDLLKDCQEIEARLGRPEVRAPASPRTIDLDILLYGEKILNAPALKIPHTRMHERAFVLIPLTEISPKIWHPVMKKEVAAILAQLKDIHEVKKIASSDDIYSLRNHGLFKNAR